MYGYIFPTQVDPTHIQSVYNAIIYSQYLRRRVDFVNILMLIHSILEPPE